MERLTKRSTMPSEMAWFVDRENNNLPLEPCEMGSFQVGKVLRRLAEYEDLEDQGLIYHPKSWQESDFSEDQLQLLRIAFKLVEDVVELQRLGNSDVQLSNELYYLKEKLGIYDLSS